MEVDEEAATKAKPWHQGPHFDEAGWPLPMADEPVPIAGPQKEHNPLVVDEIDEFVADGVRAWKEYMATPKEDRETYKVGLPVGEKDWLARLTYGGATHDEKTLEVLKGLDYLKDLPVEPEFEHMNPEVAAHFQAKKDKYWQDASDKIDEALKSFEGLDRDVAKIEREREGIEIPCQDGGSWDWEVYRREEWYRREQRKEAVAKAEAEGTPPPRRRATSSSPCPSPTPPSSRSSSRRRTSRTRSSRPRPNSTSARRRTTRCASSSTWRPPPTPPTRPRRRTATSSPSPAACGPCPTTSPRTRRSPTTGATPSPAACPPPPTTTRRPAATRRWTRAPPRSGPARSREAPLLSNGGGGAASRRIYRPSLVMRRAGSARRRPPRSKITRRRNLRGPSHGVFYACLRVFYAFFTRSFFFFSLFIFSPGVRDANGVDLD